jgi:alpha-1,6-mannosyltransferase
MTSASLTFPGTRRNALTLAATVAGSAALIAIVAISLRVATAATLSARYLVPSGRRGGFPLWMRGPLNGLGAPLRLHTFLVLMGVMVAAWVITLVCARALPGPVVAGVAVIATLIFALAPPLLSTDVFNYIAYGQMGTNGINPYLHGPVVLLGQPVYEYTGHLWRTVPSAYGPGFTLLSYALTPLGVAGAFWALKAITAAACLATGALAWATARRLGRSPTFALALVVLNPLMLVYAVGGAHNDVLTVAFVALAIYLAVRGNAALSGVSLVGAVMIKASAGLALPFLLLGARPRLRALAGVAAAGVVALGVSFAVFGTSLRHMFDALALQQHFHWIVISVPAFVAHYLGLGRPDHAAQQIFTAIAAAAAVGLIARSLGGRGWIEGCAAATLVLLATTNWVLPWYVIWALPFAALARRWSVPTAAVALSAVLMAMQLYHFTVTDASHAPRRHADRALLRRERASRLARDHARTARRDHRHVAVNGALGLGLVGLEVQPGSHRLHDDALLGHRKSRA